MNDKKLDFTNCLERAYDGFQICASPLGHLLPGQKVPVKVHVENVGNSTLHIGRLCIQFEWQKEKKTFFGVNCEYHLAPHSKGELPKLFFMTPVDRLGHFNYEFIIYLRGDKEARTRVIRTHGGTIEVTAPIMPFAKAFISYSTRNKNVVTRLSELLENSGIVAYVAERFPEFGRVVQNKIYKKLDDSDFILAVLTPSSLKSKWVKIELDYAKKKGYRIIPILRQETSIPRYSHKLGEELATYLDGLERISLDGSDIVKCAQELIPMLREEKLKEYKDFAPKEISLVELVDRILDEGIVVDARTRVSLVGLELLAIEARVVIAGVDTFLKYAEAVGLVLPAET